MILSLPTLKTLNRKNPLSLTVAAWSLLCVTASSPQLAWAQPDPFESSPKRLPPTAPAKPSTLNRTMTTETPFPLFLDIPASIDPKVDPATFTQAAFSPTSLASYRAEALPISTAMQSGGCYEDGCHTTHPASFYNDFSPTPLPEESMYHDGSREQFVYDAKTDVPVQRPLIEWGRPWYGPGITPEGINWFGSTNLVRPAFYLYGDYRTGIAGGRNAVGRTDNWASRLNLDMDLKVTDSERFHAFVGPLTDGVEFSRVELVGDDLEYQQVFNLNPVTGFFEGDMGSILGGFTESPSPFEFPFTVGLVPLLFQNGIWMEDAVTGAAFALPSRHSTLLNWANYDATFFAVVDQINSPAFGQDQNAAQAFGTAWFIEAYEGYIETGYAYVRDRNISERSYHNSTFSYTRRYFDLIGSSVRVINNTGQDLAQADRTADGTLLLLETSLLSMKPYNIIPYMNLFVGFDRPQSVARAGVSGGILRNTGINYDIDGLNGFASLDTTGSDTAGGAIGVDLIGAKFEKQLILELAYLTPHGSSNAAVPDDQYAAGLRYQMPISHRTIIRFDTMYGWRRDLEDVYGTRLEYRWKF